MRKFPFLPFKKNKDTAEAPAEAITAPATGPAATVPVLHTDSRALSLEVDNVELVINGIPFTLLKSDADIFDDSLRLADEFKKVDTKDPVAVLEALRKMTGYIEEVLGEGAVKKISGGRPVGYARLLEWIRLITGAAATSYADLITERYGD